MDIKILIFAIPLIPLLVIMGVAIGAFLASWPTTNRMSKKMKKFIVAFTSIAILALFIFLTIWSDIRVSNPISGAGPNDTYLPGS